MSCGSITCNSTNTPSAVSPDFPDIRWSWRIPQAWLSGIAMGLERRCQNRQLLELDDRLLADIGVSRSAVKEVHSSQPYMIAWRDSR
jgi:uncharacterized protein YjiS (DUF1127 family)